MVCLEHSVLVDTACFNTPLTMESLLQTLHVSHAYSVVCKTFAVIIIQSVSG